MEQSDSPHAPASSPRALREAPSISPVNGTVVGWYRLATPESVPGLVTSLRGAATPGGSWHSLPLHDRLRRITLLRRELAARAESLATMLAREAGKPLVEAYGAEILPTLRHLEWLERNAERVLAPERLSRFLRRTLKWEPHGVIGLLTPWNYPLFLTVPTLAAALAAGNTVLWKPSELALGLSSLVAEALDAAGLREVVAIAAGGPEVGEAAVDAGADKYLLVGSVATGRKVLARLGERLTPAVAELSGCDPMVVCADADLAVAARAAVWARLTGAGQTCMAPRRLYVERTVYPRFLELLEREIAAVRIANPLCEECELGPVRTEALREETLTALAEATAGGAKLVRGGKPMPGPGYYLQPALVAGCTEEMRVFQADLMAPVVAVSPIGQAEGELERISASRYALTASVWTRNRSRARMLVALLPGGVISVNDVLLPAAQPNVPFGGSGASGYGRMRGAAGLREMVRARVSDEGLGPLAPRRHLFPYQSGTVDLLRASVTLASGAPGSQARGLAQWLNAVRRYGREK